ncbi:hypothetical protein [Actinokineospora sp.]|uniref:hypothetical protein n=1 Tax=Actinokineospora sp. TaxID=1872133 RepID=UPI003D6A1AF1
MVRHQATGELRVYPHSGTFHGTNTYRPATTINYGWNSLRWIGQGRINADKFADVVAVTYDTMIVYPHSGTFNGTDSFINQGGINGTSTFSAP